MVSTNITSYDDKAKLIVCPSCQTKFALNAADYSSSEPSKFHCSRCDYVFEIDDLSEPEELNMKIDVKEKTKESFVPTGLKIPNSFDPNINITPPIETEDNTQPMNDEEQISFDFPEKKPEKKSSKKDQFVVQDMDSIDLEETTEFDQFHPEAFTAPKKRKVSPFTKLSGFWTISIPVALFLLMLGAFTILLSYKLDVTAQLIDTFSPHALHVAPPGVHISRVKYRRVVLTSGQPISILTGEIVNNSEKTIKELNLEGIVFDSLGEQLASTKVYAGADLSNTKIKALSKEMIVDLQDSPAPGKFKLSPNANYQFTFAIPTELTTLPSYYSTRVYSVRY